MSDQNKPIIHFGNLNLLGKAVYIGGFAVRLMTDLIDATIDKAVDLALETEKAFKQGRDPRVEDAKIIDEYEE